MALLIGFRGAARAPPPLAGRGFVDAAVICLGASGGDSVDGRKLNIGPRSSSTLYCTAIARARSRGTHVPMENYQFPKFPFAADDQIQ